jgi:hypothetical protein
MQRGRRKLWLLASLLLVAVAFAAPYAPTPLAIPREKSCEDKIVSSDCVLVNDSVETFCCRPYGKGHLLYRCPKVEEWFHTKDKTYHYRNPRGCVSEDIACSPYTNDCD